ncbi:vacuolar protein sorting-associated protein [Ophiostoma piceae UAMH 11346]|uniref:Vacuolar protein sorting-associated protein n=1 Tax=Ophiostoma piceae (strain UAMH 11346) TaxID=1262450 RepID=S3BQR9_OPHP1|nr:vacuolar protein sorting-associated protein [Ophiostoma piceae UAMH 11346]
MADINPPAVVVVVPPRPSLIRRTSAYFHRLSKMYHIRRIVFLVVSFFVVVFVIWLLPNLLNPTPPSRDEKKRDKKWIDSSPYWVDRQACSWFSLCGVHHLRWDDPSVPRHNTTKQHPGGELRRDIELRSLAADDFSDYTWLSRESTGQESWEIAVPDSTSDASEQQQQQSATTKRDQSQSESKPTHPDVPGYVLDYAPLVHLYSGENFWPSHIDEHIKHMVAYTDGEPVQQPENDRLNLDNIYQKLNNITTPLYLTSEVDVESRPEWLHSHDGIPLAFDNDGGSDDNDGINRGGNPDAKNGHDYEQPPQEFSDDTTWHSVDRDHPLERISDPRKLPNPMWGAGMGELKLKARSMGPEDARMRNIRKAATEQVVMGDVKNEGGNKGVTEDGESFTIHGYEPDEGGYSKAPAILVLVDKGSGILDAFWFFFYSYNLGQTVLKVRYGNHVGDWEHSMIRFENGVPRALFLSEHAGGQAYAWDALEKRNATSSTTGLTVERPVIYSAVGSHAMYALPGTHPYVLPFKMLRDETDRGPLWDPAKNNLAYYYDYKHDKHGGGAVEEATMAASAENEGDGLVGKKRPGTKLPSSLVAASKNADASTSWFHFRSPWGDETYELGDARQWRLFGQYHYITGPQGPKFKNLGRNKVCQTKRCRILYSLDAGKKASWYS